jgi:hypothetical protein
MDRRLTQLCCSWWMVLIAFPPAFAASRAGGAEKDATSLPYLVLLDGSKTHFQSIAVDESGRLEGNGLPPDLTLDDLQRIEVTEATKLDDQGEIAIVELRGGGRLAARRVTIADEKCYVDCRDASLAVPLDVVTAIRFAPGEKDVEFEKAIAAPLADRDRVFVKAPMEAVASVTGTIESLSNENLKVDIEGQVRELSRDQVFGVIVAQPAAREPSPRCLVTFRDGSMLGGNSLSISDGKTTMTLTGTGTVRFAWSAVARVLIRSHQVAFLSDLKPVLEEQQPIVTWPLPAQRDKSVVGSVLTIADRSFDKGLGVHARSALTFAADKSWDTLAATIGLDASSGGRGDCVFVVEADGKKLLRRRMKGSDPPHNVSVTITGCDRVTLTVEPGEGLDLADHADWCDARFIRSRGP